MVRIYLVRHGQVEWNSTHAYAGQTDLTLNEAGRKQAESLAGYFEGKDISAVYSSDLIRTCQTAEIIAVCKGLAVQKVPPIREINYGEWEGLTEKEIASRYPAVFPKWRLHPADVRIPGGETFGDLENRAFRAFVRIAALHRDEQIIIVSHKSVNRVLLCSLLGIDINRYRSIGQENACVNAVRIHEDKRMVVESINDRCHLA